MLNLQFVNIKIKSLSKMVRSFTVLNTHSHIGTKSVKRYDNDNYYINNIFKIFASTKI